MVRVHKHILLDLDTRHAVCGDEMPAVLVISRLIYIRQEFRQGFADREKSSVEQTDSTFLFQRILHLLLRDLIRLALLGRGRELCRISPFWVCRQDIIGIKPRLVHFLELKSTVLRTGRPVHKLIRLIGTFIKIINA